MGGGEVAVSRRQRQILHQGRHLCLPPPSRGIRQFSTREIKPLRQMSADSGLLRKKMIAATGLAGVISNVLFFACSESLFVLICRYVKNCHRRAQGARRYAAVGGVEPLMSSEPMSGKSGGVQGKAAAVMYGFPSAEPTPYFFTMHFYLSLANFGSARKSSSSVPAPCAGAKAKGKPRLYSQ